jgi:hypothetical protein
MLLRIAIAPVAPFSIRRTARDDARRGSARI